MRVSWRCTAKLLGNGAAGPNWPDADPGGRETCVLAGTENNTPAIQIATAAVPHVNCFNFIYLSVLFLSEKANRLGHDLGNWLVRHVRIRTPMIDREAHRDLRC